MRVSAREHLSNAMNRVGPPQSSTAFHGRCEDQQGLMMRGQFKASFVDNSEQRDCGGGRVDCRNPEGLNLPNRFPQLASAGCSNAGSRETGSGKYPG